MISVAKKHNENTENMTEVRAFHAGYIMDELCHAYDSDAMDLAGSSAFSQEILIESIEVEELRVGINLR